jgi:hypothetical protein
MSLTRREFLRNSLVAACVPFLPRSGQAQEAKLDPEHTIAKSGLKEEDVLALMTQDDYRFVLNGEEQLIPMRQFVRNIMHANVQDYVHPKRWEEGIGHEPENIESGVSFWDENGRSNSADDIYVEKWHAPGNKTVETISPYGREVQTSEEIEREPLTELMIDVATLRGDLVPDVRAQRIGEGEYSIRSTANGSIFGLSPSTEEYEALLRLADGIYPEPENTRRNMGKDVLVDRHECGLISNLIRNVRWEKHIKPRL